MFAFWMTIIIIVLFGVNGFLFRKKYYNRQTEEKEQIGYRQNGHMRNWW